MSTGTRLPIGELHAVLDEVLAVDPVYLTTAEKRSASLGLARAEARLQAARLRLLAASADVAEETGDRSAATWLANETREAHGTVRRDSALAGALEARWTHVADTLGRGSVNLAQARVIATSLDALPRDLGADLLAKAEALLVDEAATLGPRELRVFGSRVLEYLAPEAADEVEHGRLLAEERRAQAATRLSMRPGETVLPTSAPGSPTTRRTGCGPTSTPTPRLADATSTSPPTTRWRGCPSTGNAARRSWPSWRTSSAPVSRATAASRPP